MNYPPPPPPRPATEAQVTGAVYDIKAHLVAVTDAQLGAAVRDIKGHITTAVVVATMVLWFGIVVVGPVAQRVLEAVAPDLYCSTFECVLVNDDGDSP